MTPQEFIAIHRRSDLSERSACHTHFNDLCEVLGQKKPVHADPDGTWYTFERGVRKTTGDHGWADVWLKDKFGWEYKKKRRDLDAAYQQLLQYRMVICVSYFRWMHHDGFIPPGDSALEPNPPDGRHSRPFEPGTRFLHICLSHLHSH